MDQCSIPQPPNAFAPNKVLTLLMDPASLAHCPATLTQLELNVSNVKDKPSTIKLQDHASHVLGAVYSIIKLRYANVLWIKNSSTMINAINASKDISIVKQKNYVSFVGKEENIMLLRSNATASRIRRISGTIKHVYNVHILTSSILSRSPANLALIMKLIT